MDEDADPANLIQKYDVFMSKNATKLLLNGMNAPEFDKFLKFFTREEVHKFINAGEKQEGVFKFIQVLKHMTDLMSRVHYIELHHIITLLEIIDKLDFQGFVDDLRPTIRRLAIVSSNIANDEWKEHILGNDFTFKSATMKAVVK